MSAVVLECVRAHLVDHSERCTVERRAEILQEDPGPLTVDRSFGMQKAVEVQYAARSGGGGGKDKGKGGEEAERKKADNAMKASGNRGV